MNESKNVTEVKLVEKSFDIVLLLKSLFAAGEIIGGLAMFFVTPSRLNGLIQWISRGEIQEDPHDFLANLLINFGHHFTVGAQYLAAVYLLSHGLIKMVTLFLLWKKVLWAYPLSVIVFAGFIIYQLNEFVSRHSIFMLLVSLIDLLMIVLTILEYRNLKGTKK